MNNLINIGFNKETIDELIENYGVGLVSGINAESLNTSKICELIKAFGISDINDYIYYHIDIFTYNYDNVKNIIMTADLDKLKKEVINDKDYLAEYITSNI